MSDTVPRDENAAEKEEAAVTKLKTQLAGRQSRLSKHLAQNRAERQKSGPDGSNRSTM